MSVTRRLIFIFMHVHLNTKLVSILIAIFCHIILINKIVTRGVGGDLVGEEGDQGRAVPGTGRVLVGWRVIKGGWEVVQWRGGGGGSRRRASQLVLNKFDLKKYH